MRNFLIVFGIFLLCVSCDTDTVVSGNQNISGGWDVDQPAVFEIPQLDSLRTYNMFLNVRNTNDYKFNNLFLIVRMDFPHGKVVTDTLEYRMAHPDGTWMGQGIGSVKENKLWYKEGIRFAETGNYNITITHAVRNNGAVEGVKNLEGITDVGYSIEKTDQEE